MRGVAPGELEVEISCKDFEFPTKRSWRRCSQERAVGDRIARGPPQRHGESLQVVHELGVAVDRRVGRMAASNGASPNLEYN